jgi:ABC-type cobalamin/Fe3+-siderophores transport system ATPase subunit
LLSVAGLTKIYGRGEGRTIDRVTFSAAKGEVLGVVGPNGAGKTTLLEAIAGLVPVESGQVFWCDEPLQEEGLDRLMEALTLADKTLERGQEAELHRLRSELQQMVPGCDPAAVEASFRRAMAVAQSQGARLWELRAANALACFWVEHGKFLEGHQLVGPIYARFTEGHETADLREAKALLDN